MELFLYDRQVREEGYPLLCGGDEAGRGPLAGPVCAAAVILPANVKIPGLDDSKKLSDKRRRELFPVIQETALAYAIAFADHREIDEMNILQATFLAMQRALDQLKVRPDLALIDGNRNKEIEVNSQPVVKGDSKCADIAAASILAKTFRDDLMVKLDARWPEYGFAKHKGYPTKDHREAILRHGICDHHRRTFGPCLQPSLFDQEEL